MNIETIAAEAVSLLEPYLNGKGNPSAEKSVEHLPGKVGALYRAVTSAFAGDAYAEQTLKRAAEMPDQDRLAALKSVLKDKMKEDSGLTEILRGLVESKSADQQRTIIIGDRNSRIGGSVIGSTIITGRRSVMPSPSQGAHDSIGKRQAEIVQVFISSTWLDLRPEREAVEEALQRMRETKYVGMEYFGSRDENTERASLIEVERSNVYIGIFAGRYGSGITGAEYRLARKLNKPCFIYVKDDAAIPPQWRETDAEKSAHLAALKSEASAHTVSAFGDPAELAAKVTADLHRWLFDEYLTPRLREAAGRGSASEEGQRLLGKIRDFDAIDADLLNRLKSLGYTIIIGDDNLDVGKGVIDSQIIRGEL